MTEPGWLAEQFEQNRPHLQAVAYGMLGSVSEAQDAVQEAWLRLSHSDTGSVDDLRAWLTTVVGRISLDMLRSRKARREYAAGSWPPRLASPCWSCWRASPRPSASRSSCTTCSRCRSTRSPA